MGSKRDKRFLNKIFGNKTLDEVMLMENSFLEKRDHYEKEHLKAVIGYMNTMERAMSSSKLYEDELKCNSDKLGVLMDKMADFEAEHGPVLAKVKNLAVARKNLVACIGTMNDLGSLEKIFEQLVKLEEKAKKILGSEKDRNRDKKALYGEAESCFSGVHKLCRKLEKMGNLAKITRIKAKTDEIKDFFVDMVFEDFGEFKAAKGKEDFSHLCGGCRMLETATVASGHKEKKELCDWITEIHSQKFEQTFKTIQKLSFESLNRLINDYKNAEKEYFEKYVPVIPKEWALDFQLAENFFFLGNEFFENVFKTDTAFTNNSDLFFAKIIISINNFEKEIKAQFSKTPQISLKTPFSNRPQIITEPQKQNLTLLLAKLKKSTETRLFSEENLVLGRIKEVEEIVLFIKKCLILVLKLESPRILGLASKEYFDAINSIFVCIEVALNKVEKITDNAKFLDGVILLISTCQYLREVVLDLHGFIIERIGGDCDMFCDLDEALRNSDSMFNKILTQTAASIAKQTQSFFSSFQTLNWDTVKSIGDPMAYTVSVHRTLEKNLPFLHKSLSKKHFLIFFGKFLALFGKSYLRSLFLCRNLTKTGAQQLLLDVYSIKSSFGRFADGISDESTRLIIKSIVKDKIVELEAHLKVLSADEVTKDTFSAILPAGSTKTLKRLLLVKGASVEEKG